MARRKKKRKRPGRSLARELASGDADLLIGEAARKAVTLTGVIPTGLEQMDIAIGRGGLPIGRVSMVQGAEGGGKSTFCLSCCRSVQEMGGIAVYCEPENKLDLGFVEKNGVDSGELILVRKRMMEEVALKIRRMADRVIDICESRGRFVPTLIVVDSITALDTYLETSMEKLAAEKEKDRAGLRVGAQAAAMSALLRKLVPIIADSPIALLLVSQLRTKLKYFGAVQDSTCGNAPKFYSSLILQFRPSVAKDEAKRKVGALVEYECVKNQIAQPFKGGEFSVLGARGLDRSLDLLRAAVEMEVAVKKGSWYTFRHGRLKGVKVQGARGLRMKMRKRPDMFETVRRQVREAAGWE